MFYVVFFFKQKTAYDMRISDWSSDVCSSDLSIRWNHCGGRDCLRSTSCREGSKRVRPSRSSRRPGPTLRRISSIGSPWPTRLHRQESGLGWLTEATDRRVRHRLRLCTSRPGKRSEEHTSELQSLMRNSYAVFCLTKKKKDIL